MNKVFIFPKKKLLVVIVCFLMAVVFWFMFNVLYNKQDSLQQHINAIEQEHQVIYNQIASKQTLSPVDFSSNAHLWRSIQERAQDTVVQIFVQIAMTDILQPYKTPEQNSASGSGFFFNEEGDILTNAHVVIQARSIWIQIPHFGKHIFDVEVISICPDRDVALLRLTDEGKELIRKELGAIPFLRFGDSDLVRRSDEVIALGYPLAQHSLKHTRGSISGWESGLFQISAPINPGSSGGPLLNSYGEVVGINSSGRIEAQNVGYAILINEIVRILPDMYKTKILPKGFLGAILSHGSPAMREYLGNPLPGGYYVVDVIKNGLADKVGINAGDMLYQLNGYDIDMYGEMTVPWSEDKISLSNYIARLSTGDRINILAYRNGEKKEFTIEYDFSEPYAITTVYPEYENIDYEIFGGFVVMELTMNHIRLLSEYAPGLTFYADLQNRNNKVLIITQVFSNSLIYRLRFVLIGNTIKTINEKPVTTLKEYREAIRETVHEKFLRIVYTDNVTRVSENLFIVLPMKDLVTQERRLARENRYQMTQLSLELEKLLHIEPSLTV